MAKSFKLTCQITFDINGTAHMSHVDKTDLRYFIKEALETWGGQRHPDDWLFDSLERVQVSAIQRVHEHSPKV